jgi:hypothetical protein
MAKSSLEIAFTKKKEMSDKAQLQQDLDKLTAADIPVDIDFKQGIKVLGL